jgi:hypothetical protein
MSRNLTRVALVLATAMVSVLASSAGAQAARRDTTAPTAPYISYASGLKWFGGCLPLTIGLQRSTDNATAQTALRYEVFADGVLLGTLTDTGTSPAVWGRLTFKHAGSNRVTARAVDAAGNRSVTSNTQVITAYGC